MKTEEVLSEEERQFIVEIIGVRYRYTPKDFYLLYNDPSALKRFYNSLIRKFKGLPTISPIYDSAWAAKAAEWLCEGENVAELGCGDGTFAKYVMNTDSCEIKKYYLVDFSEDVLKAAHDTIKKFEKNKRYILRNWDIENISEVSGLNNKLDRIISINTFGDTRLDYAFRESYKVLKDKGLLRATLYSKEIYDEFWAEETGKTYFSRGEFGIWFTPPELYEGTYEPMGHIFTGGKRYQDFVRIQRYYTAEGWKSLLEHYGFKIVSCEYVTYPPKVVIERWGTRFGKKLGDFVRKYNGFPECWDVIARKEGE